VRVILDTNIFVSGIFFGGPPSRILEAWRDGSVRILTARKFIDQYLTPSRKGSAGSR